MPHWAKFFEIGKFSRHRLKFVRQEGFQSTKLLKRLCEVRYLKILANYEFDQYTSEERDINI